MLWIPGPTEVRPEILAEFARPTIGHRSPAMGELIERLDPGLRLAFGLEAGSDSHVAAHTTTASGLMETALFGVGPKVLSLVIGAFSKRFAQIAEILGKDVTKLEVPMGQVVTPEMLSQALDENGPFDAVTVVWNETSTGTSNPIPALAEVLRAHPDTRLLVDVVSWIAGAPIDLDQHRIDFAFAGVQKALALPPGIAVCGVSDRYLEGARKLERRTWYHDPVMVVEGHADRKTPMTPAIPHYTGLAKQLEDISNGVTLPEAERGKSGVDAWNARFAKHARMQASTAAWAAGHGLSLLPSPEFASPTVSCIQVGDLDVGALVKGLKARDLEISNGYGDLKGKTFRIGHMGDHTEDGLNALLQAADEVLAS
tara:strand:- start:10127 stop:11236 length:1110 start_codon:yes stop_codon:yes gene_type:complete